eukprot:571844-Rhodomonas_salina.2
MLNLKEECQQRDSVARAAPQLQKGHAGPCHRNHDQWQHVRGGHAFCGQASLTEPDSHWQPELVPQDRSDHGGPGIRSLPERPGMPAGVAGAGAGAAAQGLTLAA